LRILIATVREQFTRGGAEILAEDLRESLVAAGHDAEIVAIPFHGYPTDDLIDNLTAFRLLDLSTSRGSRVDRLIALKFPAYLISHPRKVIWLVHQLRGAYELWDEEHGLSRQPAGMHARVFVSEADRVACTEAYGVFSISKNVAARLRRSTGHEAHVLYPPPRNASRYRCSDDRGYLFFPSRIVPLKRQHLVIEALARTRHPVRVAFSGPRENEEYAAHLEKFAKRLGVATRVTWHGALSENELITAFARCRGVVFPPVDEDYGYVSLESMLASKPVITCHDSGGTLEFVVDRETGLVTDPNAAALAAAMDELWTDPERARTWGEAGRRLYEAMDIGWQHVLGRLLA
jgi:glycosyltransferase involved in cell wall biosynthesis